MKKVLIIQNKYIGDVLISSLIAKNIKKFMPDSEVHFFCYNNAVCILENNPYIDKIISFNTNELKKLSILLNYSKIINKEKYDIIIDPYGKLQSRVICLLSKAKIKIAYNKSFFRYVYTNTLEYASSPKYFSCTAIESRLMLLNLIVPKISEFDDQIEIFLTEKEISDAKNLMISSGIKFDKPVIMLGILGSREEKTFPLKYMAEITNYLINNYDIDILFNYVPSQQKEVDKLLEFISYKSNIHLNILGNNIREFSAILYNCDTIIGNEGGSINIAKSIKKPSFSIISPHVYKKEWDLYGNIPIYQSFHLEDIRPEIFETATHRELRKNYLTYYQMMTPDKIIPKINAFLNSINIKSVK